MQDQVQKLRAIGISAVSLSRLEGEEQAKAVEAGEFSFIYGTPESWVNGRWRRMLTNSVLKSMVCAVAIDELNSGKY